MASVVDPIQGMDPTQGTHCPVLFRQKGIVCLQAFKA